MLVGLVGDGGVPNLGELAELLAGLLGRPVPVYVLPTVIIPVEVDGLVLGVPHDGPPAGHVLPLDIFVLDHHGHLELLVGDIRLPLAGNDVVGDDPVDVLVLAQHGAERLVLGLLLGELAAGPEPGGGGGGGEETPRVGAGGGGGGAGGGGGDEPSSPHLRQGARTQHPGSSAAGLGSLA